MAKFKLSFIAGILITLSLEAQVKKPDFTWGVNGHPLSQKAYSKETLPYQIEFIKDLNLDSYRFDVPLDSNGYAKSNNQFQQLLNTLNKNKIRPLPTLIVRGLQSLETNQIYNFCYRLGKNFALRYGSNISILEIGNEEDNKIIVKGNGMNASHYDVAKIPRILNKISGFIDGVKSISPKMKITLSVSYLHWYYLDLLQKYNVKYDIIGYHWYSNMGDITNDKSFGNILLTVSRKYNKEVWITEFNYHKGSEVVSLSKQADYYQQSIPKIISKGKISGFFIYELFDQPGLKVKNPDEAWYGLVGDAKEGFVKKNAYFSYKQIISDN